MFLVAALFDRHIEELLTFLLVRIGEAEFEQLVIHEPKRMMASYIEHSRSDIWGFMFTGCATCSRIPANAVFPSVPDINVESWPCMYVRSLCLPFADDPSYREWWRPEHIARPSGMPLHRDDDDLSSH